MGGVSTPALAGAVAAVGGVGMLAGTGRSAEAVADELRAASALGGPDGVVGVNFLVPFLDRSAFASAAGQAPLVECFYGEPDRDLVDEAHDAAALMAWQVGSVDEALAAEAAGCDVVIVQGIEAGGHIRGQMPLLPLLERLRPMTELPLVAAGGIGSGAALARAMAVGADAVRIGTVLLAAAEADVHPRYMAALAAASADDTVITETFAMGWPEAPHRVLRSCVDASGAAPATRSPLPPGRAFIGDVGAAALYAGTSAGDVHEVQTAAAIVGRLLAEASAQLGRDGSEA